MGRLDHKVALITGGARGQGATEARLFAAEGASVMIGDILDDQGDLVADELGLKGAYMHHDVTDEAQWAAIVAATLDRFGRLDVLVNNAGIFHLASLLETDRALYERIIQINQIGVFLGMKAVAPAMMEQRSGSIINISSVAGLSGSAMALAYSASKWAVRGMTKCVARELAPFGIRVNSVHPGIIDTAMLQEFDALGVREIVRSRIPLGEEASPEEVARLVLFLASDDSKYSTGSEFVVDGGMTS